MSAGPALSAVVTTLDNAGTIEACLRSLAFCDDILVLDSGSRDGTPALAAQLGARVATQPFAGYSAQKQAAIDLARHDWVLLLDSDEWLDADAGARIRAAIAAPGIAGYTLPRREWLFWRWQSPASRHNRYVRLFDRRRARMSGHPVHETVPVDGPVAHLDALLWHRGDPDIAAKVQKAARYSTLQAEERAGRRVPALGARVVLAPWVAFLRYYLLRGHWREGWAGYIAARIHAFYVLQKYAKQLELRQRAADAP